MTNGPYAYLELKNLTSLTICFQDFQQIILDRDIVILIIYKDNYFSNSGILFSLPFQISASGSGDLTSVSIGHCLANSAFN